MKNKLQLATRLILGLLYFVFGLNGFLNFIPTPPNMPEAAVALSGALFATGYFFPVLKATEVICGALLLSGIAAPLALVILAPITLQIILFHAYLTPGLQNLIMPMLMLALHVLAASAFWQIYSPLFSRKCKC